MTHEGVLKSWPHHQHTEISPTCIITQKLMKEQSGLGWMESNPRVDATRDDTHSACIDNRSNGWYHKVMADGCEHLYPMPPIWPLPLQRPLWPQSPADLCTAWWQRWATVCL